jgi:hypothetical protein
MSHITIRFNKSRGQPGRGSAEHVWRVFVDGQEYLFKNFKLHALATSEKDANGEDWNIACEGLFEIDKDTSTAIVHPAIKE